jgi:hypothetical protein
MNVLWLARAIPSVFDSGDRIYTAELAAGLADAGANVTFIGLSLENELGASKLS